MQCDYCDDPAITIFISRDCGSVSDVCDMCARKLRYQEECEMRIGKSPRIQNITKDDLISANLL